MQNLVKFAHLKKKINYLWKVNTKNVIYWKNYVFLLTYHKRFRPKNPLYENENDHKKNVVLESFITIDSFDCDCPLWSLDGNQKKLLTSKLN
jgi:hypothetical protein